MRIVLPALAGACLLLPVPAAATAESDGEAGRLAEELRDPQRQGQMAATAEAVGDAVLSMPAAPMLKALAEVAGEDPDYVDPDLRFGDLIDPQDSEAPREFARRLPRMMGAMAGLAAAFEAMLPELRERIGQSLPDDYDY